MLEPAESRSGSGSRSGSRSRSRWEEPTWSIPLRWGTARERALAGLLLLVAGGIAIAGSNVFAIWLALLGGAAHLAGWAIMPAAGWRRVLVMLPSVAAMAT